MILLLFSFPFLVVLVYQVKGTVHPKKKICWQFTHSQVIQNVDVIDSFS